jgi:hypothetical protein
MPRTYGAVAQLGERRVRNAKVEGSIPFRSTSFQVRFQTRAWPVFLSQAPVAQLDRASPS